MDWKDTVMSDKEIIIRISERFQGFDPGMDFDEEITKIIKEAQAEISFKAGREKEAKDIFRCVLDAKRVHPDWVIDDVIDLLKFREETKRAFGKPS